MCDGSVCQEGGQAWLLWGGSAPGSEEAEGGGWRGDGGRGDGGRGGAGRGKRGREEAPTPPSAPAGGRQPRTLIASLTALQTSLRSCFPVTQAETGARTRHLIVFHVTH